MQACEDNEGNRNDSDALRAAVRRSPALCVARTCVCHAIAAKAALRLLLTMINKAGPIETGRPSTRAAKMQVVACSRWCRIAPRSFKSSLPCFITDLACLLACQPQPAPNQLPVGIGMSRWQALCQALSWILRVKSGAKCPRGIKTATHGTSCGPGASQRCAFVTTFKVLCFRAFFACSCRRQVESSATARAHSAEFLLFGPHALADLLDRAACLATGQPLSRSEATDAQRQPQAPHSTFQQHPWKIGRLFRYPPGLSPCPARD